METAGDDVHRAAIASALALNFSGASSQLQRQASGTSRSLRGSLEAARAAAGAAPGGGGGGAAGGGRASQAGSGGGGGAWGGVASSFVRAASTRAAVDSRTFPAALAAFPVRTTSRGRAASADLCFQTPHNNTLSIPLLLTPSISGLGSDRRLLRASHLGSHHRPFSCWRR